MEAILILSILLASIGAVLAFWAIWTVRRAPAAALSREEQLSHDLAVLRKDFDFYRQEREREVATLRAEIARLQATVETLTCKLTEDAAVKIRLTERIQTLEKQLAAYGIRGTDKTALPPSSAVRTTLREMLTEGLAEEELRLLVADVTGDPETVSGTSKALLAQNLITYCANRKMMDELLLALRRLRPDVEAA